MVLSLLTILLSFVALALWVFRRTTGTNKGASEPPMVPYYIPYLGNIVAFVFYPKTFIEDNMKKVGSISLCSFLFI
jgi:hypothetical protein